MAPDIIDARLRFALKTEHDTERAGRRGLLQGTQGLSTVWLFYFNTSGANKGKVLLFFLLLPSTSLLMPDHTSTPYRPLAKLRSDIHITFSLAPIEFTLSQHLTRHHLSEAYFLFLNGHLHLLPDRYIP